MALNQNQFAQTAVQGMMDLEGFGSNVLAARVSHSLVTALVPGQAVKVENTAGGPPVITALTANSDIPAGFVPYNLKDVSYPADARAELAIGGSVMYMTAGGAIARWGQVEVVYTTNKVIAAAGVNPVCGFAIDKAAADGDLIRVYIENAQEVTTSIASVSGLQAALNAVQAPVLPYEAETTISTAGNGVLTAAGLVGKLIKRTGPSAAFSDATDSAVAIVAALNTYVVASSFETTIKNSTIYPMTITAGSGVTLTGQSIIPPLSTARYLITMTSPTAVAIEHVMTTPSTTGLIEASTSLATVGAGTITGAGIAGMFTARTGPTSAFTDTTDTAANIIAAVPNMAVGQSFEYNYINNSVADATLAGGSSVTLSGITSVPAGGWARFLVTMTGSGTVSMVGMAYGGQTVAPIAAGSSISLTPSQSGAVVKLDTVGGSVVTLPAATGSGARYKFIVTATATSNAHKILANSVSDFLNGIVTGENANTAKCFASAAATNHSIQMPFAGTQPSGGFIGDWFEFHDVAANLWSVQGMYQAGTTPTTPFSAATS